MGEGTCATRKQSRTTLIGGGVASGMPNRPANALKTGDSEVCKPTLVTHESSEPSAVASLGFPSITPPSRRSTETQRHNARADRLQVRQYLADLPGVLLQGGLRLSTRNLALLPLAPLRLRLGNALRFAMRWACDDRLERVAANSSFAPYSCPAQTRRAHPTPPRVPQPTRTHGSTEHNTQSPSQ